MKIVLFMADGVFTIILSAGKSQRYSQERFPQHMLHQSVDVHPAILRSPTVYQEENVQKMGTIWNVTLCRDLQILHTLQSLLQMMTTGVTGCLKM
jgi:hypothetical protein